MGTDLLLLVLLVFVIGINFFLRSFFEVTWGWFYYKQDLAQNHFFSGFQSLKQVLGFYQKKNQILSYLVCLVAGTGLEPVTFGL